MKPENTRQSCENEIIYTFPEGVRQSMIAQHGKFLFTAYGCALAERRTASDMYVYTAVNCATGKKEILSRRNKQLGEGGYAGMAERISGLVISGESRFAMDRKPGEKTQLEKLSSASAYIFREILPRHGYAVRERQIELAEHILTVIGRRGVTLAESEVGTGKTHAYLIAALLAKRGRLNEFWMRDSYPGQSWAALSQMPAVISTSSIALQQAIVDDYIPGLSRVLMECGIIHSPLTAAGRKGKEHYICERHLRRFYQGADKDAKNLLFPYIAKNDPFDLTGADSLTPHIKRRVCVAEGCGKSCKFRGECRYQWFLQKANSPSVDFQITNHNYFLADVRRRAAGETPLLPDYQLVIIDEGHKFLPAARSMYGLELEEGALPTAAQDIHAVIPDNQGGEVNIHRLAKRLDKQSGRLFRRLTDNIPAEEAASDEADRFTAVMDGEASQYLSSITATIEKALDALPKVHVQPLHRELRLNVQKKLGRLLEKAETLRGHDRLICWLERRREDKKELYTLCAIPKDLDARLYRDLWKRGVPVVLTSGTLSASGDFSRAKETLGLNLLPRGRVVDTSMASPFDFRNHSLLYISERVPYPDNKDKEYIAGIAEEVTKLVKASRGHAAVLFTSYNVMGQIYALVKKSGLPFPLFRMEKGSSGAIDKFKKSGNGILFAAGALWEGIDIPGDALSMLIIVKLPFPVPDPIGEYERSKCGSMADYRNRVLLPDMAVKLRQGDGRLIRSERDTGVCAILDIRAGRHGAYRDYVLASLPDRRMTSEISDVGNFFRAVKSPEYFKGANL